MTYPETRKGGAMNETMAEAWATLPQKVERVGNTVVVTCRTVRAARRMVNLLAATRVEAEGIHGSGSPTHVVDTRS